MAALIGMWYLGKIQCNEGHAMGAVYIKVNGKRIHKQYTQSERKAGEIGA